MIYTSERGIKIINKFFQKFVFYLKIRKFVYFIKYNKILRKKKKELSNFKYDLMLHFENLCLKNKVVVKKIKNSLNLEEKIKIRSIFVPNKLEQKI
jgi:hypothetical protein